MLLLPRARVQMLLGNPWLDETGTNARSSPSTIRFVVRLWTWRNFSCCQVADLREHRDVRGRMVLRRRPDMAGHAALCRGRPGAIVASRHVHVPSQPNGIRSHPVQHAVALDVRRRAGTDVGDALLPEVLLLL